MKLKNGITTILVFLVYWLLAAGSAILNKDTLSGVSLQHANQFIGIISVICLLGIFAGIVIILYVLSRYPIVKKIIKVITLYSLFEKIVDIES